MKSTESLTEQTLGRRALFAGAAATGLAVALAADSQLDSPNPRELDATMADAAAREGSAFADQLASNLHNAMGALPASTFGVQAGTGASQSAALHAAFRAAEAAGGGRTIQLPPGEILVDGTFSLSGYSSGLQGTSAGAKRGAPDLSGTILRAVDQTGPVLDFRGFVPPSGMKGRIRFGGFTVRGDGVAGPEKKGILLDCGTNSSSIDLHDITILDTGGSGLHVKDHYLSNFRGVTVCTPFDSASRDTPYVLLEGANGNIYFGLTIRSTIFDGSADMGPSGAVRLTPGSTYQHHDSLFIGLRLENLHVPSGGAIIASQANGIVYSDTQFFDCHKVVGASNTAHFRLESSRTQNYGGNVIRGLIPGRGSHADSIDEGVLVKQHGNLIEGTKGYAGHNVFIDTGVIGTTVRLGGAFSPQASPPDAVANKSGNATNTIVDESAGLHVYGSAPGTEPSLRIGGSELRHLRTIETVSTNFRPDMSTGSSSFRFTLAASGLTFGPPRNMQDTPLYVALVQDARGGRTVRWDATYRFPGNKPPALSGEPGAVDRLTFEWSGTKWECIAQQLGL